MEHSYPDGKTLVVQPIRPFEEEPSGTQGDTTSEIEDSRRAARRDNPHGSASSSTPRSSLRGSLRSSVRGSRCGPSRKTVLLIWGTITVTLVNFAYFTAGYFALKHFQAKYTEESAERSLELFAEQRALIARYPALHNNSKYEIYSDTATLLCYITQNPRQAWSFWSAMDFCVSVVTTVGYGVLHPTTRISKLLCCIYAMIGLPLYIVMLGAAGKYIVSMFEYLNAKSEGVRRVCTHQYAELMIAYVNIAIVMGIFLWGYSYFGYSLSRVNELYTNTSVIELPGYGFNYTADTISVYGENWTMPQAVYYSMISLTTIGFGDYYLCDPEKPKQAAMLFASVSFGFALFSYAFQTYAKASEASMSYIRDKTTAMTAAAAQAGLEQLDAAAQSGLGQLEARRDHTLTIN